MTRPAIVLLLVAAASEPESEDKVKGVFEPLPTQFDNYKLREAEDAIKASADKTERRLKEIREGLIVPGDPPAEHPLPSSLMEVGKVGMNYRPHPRSPLAAAAWEKAQDLRGKFKEAFDKAAHIEPGEDDGLLPEDSPYGARAADDAKDDARDEQADSSFLEVGEKKSVYDSDAKETKERHRWNTIKNTQRKLADIGLPESLGDLTARMGSGEYPSLSALQSFMPKGMASFAAQTFGKAQRRGPTAGGVLPQDQEKIMMNYAEANGVPSEEAETAMDYIRGKSLPMQKALMHKWDPKHHLNGVPINSMKDITGFVDVEKQKMRELIKDDRDSKIDMVMNAERADAMRRKLAENNAEVEKEFNDEGKAEVAKITQHTIAHLKRLEAQQEKLIEYRKHDPLVHWKEWKPKTQFLDFSQPSSLLETKGEDVRYKDPLDVAEEHHFLPFLDHQSDQESLRDAYNSPDRLRGHDKGLLSTDWDEVIGQDKDRIVDVEADLNDLTHKFDLIHSKGDHVRDEDSAEKDRAAEKYLARVPSSLLQTGASMLADGARKQPVDHDQLETEINSKLEDDSLVPEGEFKKSPEELKKLVHLPPRLKAHLGISLPKHATPLPDWNPFAKKEKDLLQQVKAVLASSEKKSESKVSAALAKLEAVHKRVESDVEAGRVPPAPSPGGSLMEGVSLRHAHPSSFLQKWDSGDEDDLERSEQNAEEASNDLQNKKKLMDEEILRMREEDKKIHKRIQERKMNEMKTRLKQHDRPDRTIKESLRQEPEESEQEEESHSISDSFQSTEETGDMGA